MMMLVVSLVLGVLPLAGIGWIVATGMITPWPPSATVDGLFMSLILLTLSLCFLLNAYWEARDQGLLAFLHQKEAAPVTAKTPAPAKAPIAPKTTTHAAVSAASEAPAAKVSS
jgi:hypothetical protein